MAHQDTVYVDPEDRFSIDFHVCAESLHGDWCFKVDRVHTGKGSCKWYAVTQHDDDGWGEIASIPGPDGRLTDHFETKAAALRAAQQHFGGKQ